MGTGPRNYSLLTIKKLYSLAGNCCSFPSCNVTFLNPENETNYSNICHIEDAKEGEGDRFNPNMTDKQRADFDNLILLCPNCHIKTNDASVYTVEALKEMKSEHEAQYALSTLIRNPSMLQNAISAILTIQVDDNDEDESLSAFDPQTKIDYNKLRKNAPLIHRYKVYHEKINSLYDELETQGSMKKELLLSVIRNLYLEVRGNYVREGEDLVQQVQNNADNIMDDVYDALYAKMESSGLWDEEIIIGIRMVVVDAFMRCKILEEPIV